MGFTGFLRDKLNARSWKKERNANEYADSTKDKQQGATALFMRGDSAAHHHDGETGIAYCTRAPTIVLVVLT